MVGFAPDGSADGQVTIGEEGFFGPGDPHVSCNPGYPNANWPAYSGQDFTNNHRNKAIDFTVHLSSRLQRMSECAHFAA